MQASKEGFSVIPIKNESAWQGTSDCRSCQIRNLVLFSDLEESDFEFIHAPIDDLNFPAGERSTAKDAVHSEFLPFDRAC